eukprot:Unigene12072_Nuclearia_a/m.36716 Unigene12072_Nuclearia_a/g.36716  ORF Unigene12072_Nuclearia_a/g.36716 Unigene12072_Nuclearia_a/m.36716 type:complete len:398 (+) Unigene12072_Nuclearia_a:2137-3330(+)
MTLSTGPHSVAATMDSASTLPAHTVRRASMSDGGRAPATCATSCSSAAHLSAWKRSTSACHSGWLRVASCGRTMRACSSDCTRAACSSPSACTPRPLARAATATAATVVVHTSCTCRATADVAGCSASSCARHALAVDRAQSLTSSARKASAGVALTRALQTRAKRQIVRIVRSTDGPASATSTRAHDDEQRSPIVRNRLAEVDPLHASIAASTASAGVSSGAANPCAVHASTCCHSSDRSPWIAGLSALAKAHRRFRRSQARSKVMSSLDSAAVSVCSTRRASSARASANGAARSHDRTGCASAPSGSASSSGSYSWCSSSATVSKSSAGASEREMTSDSRYQRMSPRFAVARSLKKPASMSTTRLMSALSRKWECPDVGTASVRNWSTWIMSVLW